MKKLAYGMLFGMTLLVGCQEPKKTAPPTDKPATEKADEMKGPASEAPAETPAEPASEKKD